MPSKVPYVAAALLLYVLVVCLYFPVAPDHPFAYDEADYMWAGKQGLWANYGEANALSFAEFVRKGLELSRDSTKRQSFSQFIRSTGDIGMYRHYHGPTYAYWLAVLQDLGVTREQVFRGSGLIFHLTTATLILFGFWAAFPAFPRLAGLVACALFLFNRTALVAALGITQHVVFTLLTVSTLFAATFFFRTLQPRWFYATLASLAVAFCTVETSALLVAALVLGLLVEHRRIRERWPTLKSFGALLAKGIGVFVLTMLVCWPKGVLHLGIAKGFLTLAYISIYRKTFSPFTVLDLWKARFDASPWEFSLLIAGVIAAMVLWRGSAHRRELLPWLAFIAVFFVIMLKVTVPYTYYYAPLTAAFSVATGAAFGMLWNRLGMSGRILLSLPILVSIAGTTIQYHEVARRMSDSRPYHFAVLRWVKEHPGSPGRQLYLPYQLVPTVHYYDPELSTVGYDLDSPIGVLSQGITSPTSSGTVMCEKAVCEALQAALGPVAQQPLPLDPVGPNGTPFYTLSVQTHAEAH